MGRRELLDGRAVARLKEYKYVNCIGPGFAEMPST